MGKKHKQNCILLGKKHKENCILCEKVVRTKQHAIQCDSCGMWQHRKCNTGRKSYISRVIRKSVCAYGKSTAA